MNFIFAAVTLALKYYMLAQLPGDANLAYFGFGHEFHQLERENSIDILCPFASETFCSPVPIAPVPPMTKTGQCIVDSAPVTLKLPLSLPATAPSWSPSVQPPVNPEIGASHNPAPTSTYKYVPVENVLEEPSCISMIFIVVLILSTIGVAIGCLMSGISRSVEPQTETITKGAAEESHRSVLTWPVLSCILVAVCFGRASVPSSLSERILDVLCFFLLLSVSVPALLKFPRVSSDIAHQQRTSHKSSESIFGDKLSTSIAIESSVEEANTKDECKDSSIPRAGSVNSCVVASFESVTSNEAGNSSRTVMSTSANRTISNSMIDTAVPTPFEHDDTHGTTIQKADESATIVDPFPKNTSTGSGFIDLLTAPLPESIEAELEINAFDVLLPGDQSD
ncbi:hypothetical protein ACEPAH_1480 [Sanghuangporus vaninii]